MENLTSEKCKDILQILYNLKSLQIEEETGIEVTVKLVFKEDI